MSNATCHAAKTSAAAYTRTHTDTRARFSACKHACECARMRKGTPTYRVRNNLHKLIVLETISTRYVASHLGSPRFSQVCSNPSRRFGSTRLQRSYRGKKLGPQDANVQ